MPGPATQSSPKSSWVALALPLSRISPALRYTHWTHSSQQLGILHRLAIAKARNHHGVFDQTTHPWIILLPSLSHGPSPALPRSGNYTKRINRTLKPTSQQLRILGSSLLVLNEEDQSHGQANNCASPQSHHPALRSLLVSTCLHTPLRRYIYLPARSTKYFSSFSISTPLLLDWVAQLFTTTTTARRDTLRIKAK
ncbi:hypothetical protein BDQ17DRAFT_1548023 [Cyathus striatus]|nr:hypothetical protein BDQ17DRAFT_1548023 [Cyathus striatus]